MTPSVPKRVALLVMLLVAPMSLMPTSGAAAGGGGAKYYVDASGGDDAATGTTPAAAWRTLDRVNATVFQPGDEILLRAGQRWTGQLWPKGSGQPGRPIVIDRYGQGEKPEVNGAGQVADAVRLHNQEHWEIRNLRVSNANPLGGGQPGTNLRDLRGIGISGDMGGQLNHFRIDAVDVHDVTGEINWIGGDPAGNRPGITFRTGWDRSKNTGGIVLRGLVADAANPGSPTVLNDILIENSTVSRTSFAGIIVKQHTGSNPGAVHTGWGERASRDDPRFAPHTNVVIRGNFITQEGTDYGCNGMYLTGIRGGLVERNVVYRTGTSGIEAYYADDIVIQHNEVYETEQKAGGADSNGIDPDNGTTNIVVQYNFVHDNGDGILLCQCGRGFGDAWIRYNIIKSNTRYQIYLHSNRGATAYIYNNTIVNDVSDHLVYGYGNFLQATYHLWNNIFYSTRANASLTTSPTIDYESNVYGGAALTIPSSDTKPVVGDPMFLGQVTGPYGTAETGPRLDRALPLRVASGSRAVGTGISVENNGGADYSGATVYNGPPDIGAFEYRTPPGQASESINGFVHDQYGRPVPAADVVLESHGKTFTTTTEHDGFYRIAGVRFGGHGTLTLSKADYVPATGSVTVALGGTTRHDVTLVTTRVDGTIQGRVLDERAQPLQGALVSVLSGGNTVATSRSTVDGTFSVAGIPAGEGYAVQARMDGRLGDQKASLSVTPGQTTDAGGLLLPLETATAIQEHTFDALPVGPFAGGTNGWQVTSTGNAVDVVAVPSETDRSVRLTRTANTGGTPGTNMTLPFAQPLQGLVTIEARVMRSEPYVSGNNWFSLPYVYNTNGAPAVSFAFDKGNIVAYEGTTSRILESYELGRWYRIKLVIDTVNQRFDLSIDGQPRIDDGRFRNAMPAIGSLSFYANSSNYGSAYVDNVTVAYGRA
ncbi:carboxypeptidase regulatory-like domain-containing protein [Allorhizocola rhizosphaerae]|uniref:carboxypeptidase regulatory-like domain-containing protein n=1 Tax=Allorhizocola rhizosphaerae TaxID=1872709 RepID=UPI0013C2B051|nr:carboxypeptidase regulatory-like domain-containing protein [Allorhizocola rhizosphaerae]